MNPGISFEKDTDTEFFLLLIYIVGDSHQVRTVITVNYFLVY